MAASSVRLGYRDSAPSAEEYVRALVNILDDFAAEKARLQETQHAILNILADFTGEKARLQETQAAVLNILADFAGEKEHLTSMQRAVINVLDDAHTEKLRLEATQAAVLNILDDSSAEKDGLQNIQRAIFNILDDLHVEKSNLEVTRNQLIESSREVQESHRHLEKRVAERTADLAVSNKELESFAYSVSHDLRAPLRHLNGFLTLLRKRCYDVVDESGRHYIDAVLASSQRMGTLIDDLLQFSRLGRAAIRRTPVRLNGIVDELRRELQEEMQDRAVRWNISPLPAVMADQGMLRLVFQNLLGNALKFTRTKDEAEINIAAAEDEAGNVVISVADNGVGFDMEYYNKLFQVFQRLHGEDEFEGTGIGLANVRKIVERHEGRVWAQSELGKGATFYVSLPRVTGQIGEEADERIEAHSAG